MCGITGYFGINKINLEKYYNAHLLLKHRGPDDEGFILNDNSSNIIFAKGNDTIPFFTNHKHISSFKETDFILGHRRLSIIDLTEKGHQPMPDNENRYYITLNGEIFNYIELRKELIELGYKFKSENDAEVFLYSYIEWKEDCFNKLNGMWTAVIFDSQEKELIISRDRFGIKPLFYFLKDNAIYFSSEVKFLLEFVDKIEVEQDMVKDYIVDCSLEHKTKTMFKNIFQLKPGNFIKFNINNFTTYEYWKFKPKINNKLSYKESFQKIKNLFSSSIDFRMRSDVPVGSLLSGGLDSTAIVCDLYNRYKDKIENFQTFSVVFDEEKYSEKKYIEKTINHTNFLKNYVKPDPEKLKKEIEKILYFQEFPFRSLSVYSQWCLYKFIKNHSDVVVLLNGQGSDEIFAGYNNNYYSLLAEKLRILNISSFFKEFIALNNNRDIPRHKILTNVLVMFFENYGLNTPKFLSRKSICKKSYKKSRYKKVTKNIFLQDLFSNLKFKALPEYLRYEDRNSMAFSLEARLPFMDYRLVELGFSLPDSFKINNGVNKRIIREFAQIFCPLEIIERKDKMGFIAPSEVWFKTKLKDELSIPINNEKFFEENLDFLDLNKIKKKFNKFISGQNVGEDILLFWRIYCFYKWKEIWFEKKG